MIEQEITIGKVVIIKANALILMDITQYAFVGGVLARITKYKE